MSTNALDGMTLLGALNFIVIRISWPGMIRRDHGFSLSLFLLQLIQFGLSLFKHAGNTARLEIMWKGLPGLGVMLQHLVTLKR